MTSPPTEPPPRGRLQRLLDVPLAFMLVLATRLQINRLLGKLEVSSPRKFWMAIVCLLGALAMYFWAREEPGLGEPGARALFILALATGLWVTEATPAIAVSFLVIGLDVMLLTRPNSPQASDQAAWQETIAVLGHPLVWLFFGGFVLAAGTERSGLDRVLARAALARFGTRPASVLAGVMCVTFGFSAFMSNTATTALMLALLAPLLRYVGDVDPYKKALLLGTAVAANIGGMSSLIGTPPNAIAAGLLTSSPGQSVDFMSWLGYGLPLASVLSILGWLLLLRLYPAQVQRIDLRRALQAATGEDDEGLDQPVPLWNRLTVTSVGLITVGLWMTSGWHGLPIAVVSLLPIVVFTTFGVLSPTEIRGMPWDVLFLLAGGLTLGTVIQNAGVAEWLVSSLPVGQLGVFATALALAYLCTLVSNFMSSTAAANILLPIGVSLAPGAEAQIAIPLAFAASVGICLPISTPPNALVYSSGAIQTRDLVRVGLLFGLLVPPVAVGWVTLLRG